MSEANLNFIDVDTVLSYAGDFGSYQYNLIALFSIINILSAYHYFGQTFIALIPEYECKIIQTDKNYTASQCFLYHENGNKTFKEECAEWNYQLDYNYTTLINEVIF